MSAPDAELRREIAGLSYLQQQMEELLRQEEILRANLEDILRARETLEQAWKARAVVEVLAPTGAGGFVRAELKDVDRVVFGIGGDVSVELPIPAAIERLDARGKAIQEVQKALASRLAEMEASAQEQDRAIQALYEKSKGGKPE